MRKRKMEKAGEGKIDRKEKKGYNVLPVGGKGEKWAEALIE